MIKRKKKEKIELDAQPISNIERELKQQLSQQPTLPPQQAQQPQQNLCSTCGFFLTYIQQNNRYYCYQCQKYE